MIAGLVVEVARWRRYRGRLVQIQVPHPGAQARQSLASLQNIRNFIRQVIGVPTVGVDVVKVLMQPAGQQK